MEYTLFSYTYNLQNMKYDIVYAGVCLCECYGDRQDIHPTKRNHLLILVSSLFTLRRFSY